MMSESLSDARRMVAAYGYQAEVEADVRAAEASWGRDARAVRHWRRVADCIPQALIENCRPR